MVKDFLEEHFVKGANECSSPEDILNWYRNLYYKEEQDTERRIMAEALNEFFVKKLPELIKEAKIVATDKEIKIQAYRDFAEKLKQHKKKVKGFEFTDEFWDYAVLEETIDNILKEMTE